MENQKIKTNFFSVDLKDTPKKNYLELRPPAGIDNAAKLKELILVLDCSGSMCGSRERKANKIIQELYDSKEILSIEIIRFGSSVDDPVKYSRTNKPLIYQKADLGGTNFHLAFEELTEVISKRKSKMDCVAIFMSDGEACTPTELFAPLEIQLKNKNVPLLSVAISHHADAEVMVKLANMNGDMGMVFLKDDLSDEETVKHFSESAPLMGPVDELTVTFETKKDGKEVGKELLKYRRGEEVVGVVTPEGFGIDELVISAELEGQYYDLDLMDINNSSDYNLKASFICSYIINESKKIIGQFVMKNIEMEEAKQTIEGLKTLYVSNFNEKAVLDQIVKEHSSNGQLTDKGKNLIAKFRKDVKTINLGTLTKLNEFIVIVTNNDLGSALEAYSGQKVTSKFNKRLLQMADKNKARDSKEVEEKDILHLLTDKRPANKCMIWLGNPMEDESFAELEQNEWVGNAALILPGKVAALSPWNISNVYLKPISITNTAIPLIKNADDARRKAWMSGYNVDINSSLPLIDPTENIGFVRMAIYFMRYSTAGMNALSQLITANDDLYNPAMPNALYSVAALSTLRKADNLKEFGLAGRAYLTLLDLSRFEYQKDKKNTSVSYFDSLLQQMKDDPVKFISNKEDQFLPNESRLMIILNCTDKAFELDMKEVNKIFLLAFLRVACDQTSAQYSLADITGVGVDEYLTAISSVIENSDKKNIREIKEPVIPFGEIKENVKLYLQKLFSVYAVHVVMRDYLKENKTTLDKFYHSVLNGKVSMDDLSHLMKKTTEYIKVSPSVFLGFLTENDNKEELLKLYQSVLTLSCQSHTEKEHPKHDTQYNEGVLRLGDSAAKIIENAEKVKNNFLSKNFAKTAKKIKALKKRKNKVVKWVEKIRGINKKYPLENLRHVFDDKALSFTDKSEFATRKNMFNFIENFGFAEEDLKSLETKPLCQFQDFQITVWMKQHRRHLNGFYNFAPTVVKDSSSKEDFTQKMEKKLESFYKGETDEKYKRDFTDRMRSYLPVFSGHYYEEYGLDSYLEEMKGSGVSKEEVLTGMEKVVGGFEQLNDKEKENRKRHFEILIKEKLGM